MKNLPGSIKEYSLNILAYYCHSYRLCILFLSPKKYSPILAVLPYDAIVFILNSLFLFTGFFNLKKENDLSGIVLLITFINKFYKFSTDTHQQKIRILLL
jgi:hypothetical protein